MKNRAVIFANGELRSVDIVRKQIQSHDFIIAADGGQRHLQTLGLRPDLLIGDLDSLSQQEIDGIQSSKVEVMRFACQKDETDLELAIHAVIQRGFQDLLIIAALGGRLDQTLGNLSLLLRPELTDCQVRLDDGCEEVWLVRSSLTIYGRAGERLSLLALGVAARGIQTEGLQYSLHGETLEAHQTRGISNVMTSSVARISLSSGPLICIHARKNSKCDCQN